MKGGVIAGLFNGIFKYKKNSITRKKTPQRSEALPKGTEALPKGTEANKDIEDMFHFVLKNPGKIDKNFLDKYTVGGKINKQDENGNTIMHTFMKKINEETDEEVDENFDDYYKILVLLFSYDPDVDIVNKDGNTPLHLFVYKDNNTLMDEYRIIVLKLFIDHGANLFIKNEKRVAVFDYVLQRQNESKKERYKTMVLFEKFTKLLDEYNGSLKKCNLSIKINFFTFLEGNKTYYGYKSNSRGSKDSYKNYRKVDNDKILLCLYNDKNNCISSLDITFDDNKKVISFNSETTKSEQKKNYNKVLICVLFLFFVSNDMFYEYSIMIHSESEITEWTLFHFFKLKSTEEELNKYFTENENPTLEGYKSFKKNNKKLKKNIYFFKIKRKDSEWVDNTLPVSFVEKPFLKTKMDELVKMICP